MTDSELQVYADARLQDILDDELEKDDDDEVWEQIKGRDNKFVIRE